MLKHPVIDADAHWQESHLVLGEYLRKIAGPTLSTKYLGGGAFGGTTRGEISKVWAASSDAERLRQRYRRQPWWGVPSKTIDYATFRLPKLFYDRLDEIGIDFSIVYPTLGLSLEGIRDPELRAAAVRAYNTMAAETFKPYSRRITPVAVIPRRSPKEAVEEVTFAVKELGFKAVTISGTLIRHSGRDQIFVDALGLDNEENYDQLWQRCVDLGVAVTSHAGSLSWPDRASVTNFVANHIGHFAQANHLFARSLFLGGVTKRFPTLNIALLEGGAGWARILLNDLVGHFEKRNIDAMNQNLRPSNVNQKQLAELIDRYADDGIKKLIGREYEGIDALNKGESLGNEESEHMNDFAASGIADKEQLIRQYSQNFYFGCEADDPMTMTAFDRRMGVPLNAVFSSDIGHWDVPDVTHVLHEAYEMLEHGLLNEANFRAFTFANATHLHAGMNPDFFKNTSVEAQVRAELAAVGDGINLAGNFV